MRFLILTQYYPPEIGAPQTRLSSIVSEIKALGHEVEVVTALPNHPTGKIFPGYRGQLYFREDMDNVVVHRVWLYTAIGAGLRRILNYISFALSSLYGLWRSQRPDYVFVESPPLFLSIPGFIVARRWRAKIIFNVADLWPDSVQELGLIQSERILGLAERLEKWSYRIANRVSAVTEGIRSNLIEKKGVPASKVLFLPNGVNTELFKPRSPNMELMRSLGLEGKKVVLYAGTLGYAQGLDTVLKAAEILIDRQDIIFVFIGDGSEKTRLLEVTSHLRLENVLFLEPSPQEFVANLYSLALAGLAVLKDVPIFQGARPSKMFPIMASGVPVLYSGAGEGALLVQKKAQAGIVTSPESSQALAEGVMHLADNPGLARELGKNGRKYVEEYFNWQTLVADWLRELEGEEVEEYYG